MRNLKKILALVLALVMSLSLMATAGAKDFADKSDIEATGYQTAVDVLAELEVIRGYENGSFQPNGDITRAEVAAIIYRIATKDVKDTQAGIYTSWNKFTDVKDTAWYAGYVNYCANAKIVLGKTDTTFDPEARVTGYQVLAMILRTMGYGKNGEFYGNDWAINTAAQAKQIGIIDNILEQKLGSPATRAMVAEILFRALLTETVDYNALTGYQTNGKTLGQTQFGLEWITGVVMANEYADLEDESALSAGKTRLKVDDKDYVLNVTTDLTDIGESRTAYVQKTTQNSFNLLIDKLYDTGDNVRVESGDEQGNIKKLAKDEKGLDITDAEHFLNFGYATVGESEWRIEYQVGFDDKQYYDKDGNELEKAQDWFEAEYGVKLDAEDAFDVDDNDDPANTRLDKIESKIISGVKYRIYTRVIPRGSEITPADIAIMKGVFSVASDKNHNSVSEVGVLGYVYAGTSKEADQHDLSSEMSWRAFYDQYIVNKTNTTIDGTENGDWLKIVDNDGDGMAEYVFKTVYCMEQVLSKNNKHDYFSFGYYDENDELHSHIGRNVNYLDEVEVGDVVLAALIDGTWQIEKAPEEIKVIQTVNYREKTATTTEGDVYDQSGIALHHNMNKDVLDMGEKVEYTIYFDHFNHVGAYTTEAAETSYALLSELYEKGDQNGKYLNTRQYIAEITMGEEKTAEKEVTNLTSYLSDGALYFKGINQRYGNWTEVLQRAINHLGTNMVNPSTAGTVVHPNTYDVDYYNGAEFVYPTDATETNVAIYTYNEEKDTVEIYPAAQYAKNRAGEQLFYAGHGYGVDFDKRVTEKEFAELYNKVHADPDAYKNLGDYKWSVLKPVYAVDYVKLDVTKDIGGDQVRYDMDKADASWNQYGMRAAGYQGNYVNATHETEYYVVSRGGSSDNNKISGISYYKGYENLPKFAKNDIHAMYAVASNTTFAQDGADYWVADVIVIEADAVVASYDSVALAYFNRTKSTGTTKHLDALDNMTEEPVVDLVPLKYTWDNQWTDYGFYALFDTEVNGQDVSAGKITPITKNFNKYSIHAGTVFRSAAVWAKGEYVMVDKGDGYQRELYVGDVPVYGIYDYKNSKDWDVYDLTTSDLRTGDEIIYVYNKSGNTLKFIVVANFEATNYGEPKNRYWNNDWTEKLWEAIIKDQNPDDERAEFTLKLGLGVGEEATIICDGDTYPVEGDSKPAVADEVTIRVPSTVKFNFTLKVKDLTALLPIDDWKFVAEQDKDGAWNVTAYDSTKVKVQSEEDETKPPVIGTSYTLTAVEAIIAEAKKPENVADGVADALAKELLGIVTNLVKGAEEQTIGGKDLNDAVVEGVVTAKVNVIRNEKPDLTDAEVEALTAALTDKVNEVLENTADGASVEEVDKAVAGAVEEAKEQVIPTEPETIDVTLKAGEGIEIASAWVGDEEVDGTDDVYTVDKDADLTVILTITGVEVTEDTEVIVYSQSDAAAAPVKVTVKQTPNVTNGTVTVILPKVTAAVTYTFVLEELK